MKREGDFDGDLVNITGDFRKEAKKTAFFRYGSKTPSGGGKISLNGKAYLAKYTSEPCSNSTNYGGYY